MKTSWICLLSCFFVSHLKAQITQSPMAVTRGLNDTCNIDWAAVEGRTYFVQYSEDLVTWNYLPMIEQAAGETDISYGFFCSSNKYFLRLKYTDQVTSDPDGDDFDQDGISNIDEITVRNTDPFAEDSDQDGMPDGWELAYGFNPAVNNYADTIVSNDPGADPDLDGFTNLEESLGAANGAHMPSDPNDSNSPIQNGAEIFRDSALGDRIETTMVFQTSRK